MIKIREQNKKINEELNVGNGVITSKAIDYRVKEKDLMRKTQELAKFNELRRNYSASMMGLVNVPVEPPKKIPTTVAISKE